MEYWTVSQGKKGTGLLVKFQKIKKNKVRALSIKRAGPFEERVQGSSHISPGS